MESPYKILFERRHESLSKKLHIWQLIDDSYAGGETYTHSDYLHRYKSESQKEYKDRKKRSIYLNHVQPIVDILSGIIYRTTPERTISTKLAPFSESVDKSRSIQSFMADIAKSSLMYTTGVLIDSPEFDKTLIQNEAQRVQAGINPYAVIYKPFRIRDWSVGADGKLDWIILDNSYTDKTDPLQPSKDVIRYTLWTRDLVRSFDETKDPNGKVVITISQEKANPVKEVPFIFVNWVDIENDKVAETPISDIALISRYLYNVMSYMDEMIAAGAFKDLFWPSQDGSIPDGMKNADGEIELGSMQVIPYDANLPNKPYYDGPELSSVSPFLDVIAFWTKEMLKKAGLDKDEEKAGVQSGRAKVLEYEKAFSILHSGISALQKAEQEIFRLASLWSGNDSASVINYPNKIDFDDRQSVQDLLDVMATGIKEINRLIMKSLVSKVLNLSSDDQKIVDEAIEKWDGKQASSATDSGFIEKYLDQNKNTGGSVKATNTGDIPED